MKTRTERQQEQLECHKITRRRRGFRKVEHQIGRGDPATEFILQNGYRLRRFTTLQQYREEIANWCAKYQITRLTATRAVFYCSHAYRALRAAIDDHYARLGDF